MADIVNEIMADLTGTIPDQYLGTIRDSISRNLYNYDLIPKTRELSTIIIPKALDIYLATKKIEGNSDGTIKLYKMYLKAFFAFVCKPLEQITKSDIMVFLACYKRERGISDRTLDSVRISICSFFSWCAGEEYILKNPAANIKPIKYEKEEKQPLTDIEIEKIRGACTCARDTALIEVLYSSGCRVTELVRLNISDIDFDKREVKLFGKGNKHRTSYLSAKAVMSLKQYLASRNDDDDALFVSIRKPYKRMTKAGVEALIHRIGDSIGMVDLHPHLFRHTFATNCLKRGMDITEVQKMLGHSNINTTTIYAKVSDNSVKNNYLKLMS